MKKFRFILLVFAVFTVFSSHDMFLKFNSYFLEPNTEAVLQLFNGTFEKSDNSIDRNRMLDVSFVGNGNRTKVEASQWFVKDSITFLKFKTGKTGTWVAGVSTKSRDFEMKAEKFNDYLKNDGVLDILETRKVNGKLNDDAVEKYSKHVKTIFQVGDKLSDDWNVNLGYPIEFIPLENPYEIHSGHSLPVKLLSDGKPLTNHFVYVGYKPNENAAHGHKHEHHEESHTHNHDHEDANHKHSHNAENHSHNHEHNDEAQSHEHGHDGEDHKHNHDEENHSHDHEHNDKVHSHEHGHDDDDDDDEHKHSHKENTEKGHVHDEVKQLKTDASGIVNVNINAEGTWFLRTIHMVELDDEKLTHESNWATLTFGIGSGLGHSHEDVHEHDTDQHEHEDEGFPSYLFWIASITLIAILFFIFNKKK